MALGTVHRVGGRMTEFGDGPSVCGMTLGAVLTEQFEVTVVVGVTDHAVERRLRRRDMRMRWSAAAGPGDEFFAQGVVLAVRGLAIELS